MRAGSTPSGMRLLLKSEATSGEYRKRRVYSHFSALRELCGPVAQLGARVNRTHEVRGSNPLGSTNCPLSGHSSRLWQDIVRWPTSAERLVVASGVESQSTDQLAVVGEDADVGPGDEELNSAVLVGGSDRNVSQSAEVAKGYLAEGVDFVAANAVVRSRRLLGGGSGFDE